MTGVLAYFEISSQFISSVLKYLKELIPSCLSGMHPHSVTGLMGKA